MKGLNVDDLRQLDITSIYTKIKEMRKDIFELRIKKKTTGLDKPHLLSDKKVNLARLITVLGEKIKEVK